MEDNKKKGLGIRTTTYDLEGEVLEEIDPSHLTEEEILNSINSFKGEYSQIPPMYSALKQNGVRLYELARKGIEVERKGRLINIHNLEDILRIPLSFMELHGKEKGIAGHELIARFDNIKILKPTGNAQYEGFQILMSGSGCRNYENFLMMNKETWFDFLERVCRYPVNFPRIDLAIDDTKPYLSIPELIRLKNEGLISSQLRDTAENRSDRLKEDEIEAQGKTLEK